MHEMPGEGRSVLTMSLVSPVHLASHFPVTGDRNADCAGMGLCNRKDN